MSDFILMQNSYCRLENSWQKMVCWNQLFEIGQTVSSSLNSGTG